MKLWIAFCFLGMVAVCPAEVVRASVSSNGVQANGESSYPAVSGDGRFVAYASRASNLTDPYTFLQSGVSQVFVKNLATGETELVSVSSEGMLAEVASGPPAISADGRFVVFTALAPDWGPFSNHVQVWIRDRQEGTTQLISANATGQAAAGSCFQPTISRNGRYVAYATQAWNMGWYATKTNVAFHDRLSGKTERVSRNMYGNSPNGDSFRPSISDDGMLVVYESYASDIATTSSWIDSRDVYLFERSTGRTIHVSLGESGPLYESAQATISADGSRVAFETHSNPGFITSRRLFENFVVVKDLKSGSFLWVNPRLESGPDNPIRNHPRISGNGRYVSFVDRFQLVPEDKNGIEDVYLRDIRGLATTRISASSLGEPNGPSLYTAISDDGSKVAFHSSADNLVQQDTNNVPDVFVGWVSKPPQ